MSVYTHLDLIKDPHARTATKILYDRLAQVEKVAQGTVTLVSPTTPVDGNQQVINNLADPVSGADAVNVRTLRTLVNTAFQSALQILGIGQQNPPPARH